MEVHAHPRLLTIAATLLFAAPALGAGLATGSGGDAGGSGTPEIVGGDSANTCEWPTSVLLYENNGLCTGTLVHPEIVLYAAHCGDAFREIYFGESTQAVSKAVPVDHCRRFTTASEVGPDDYAYCKLAEPVTDVPLTPVAYGCETEMLQMGQEVAIAGFGADENGQAGRKNWAFTQVSGDFEGMIAVGGDSVSAWQGDSGGPAYLKMDDGTWRAFGIVSGGSAPGEPVFYVRMDRIVHWVERESGVDITPCFDDDGKWRPTPDCQRFSTNPTASGSWSSGCGGDQFVSGYSTTCGAGYVTDEKAPTVSIMTPAAGASFDGGPVEVTIEVEALDDSSGVQRVWLEFPGVDAAPESYEPPFVFNATFSDGEYQVIAHAEDREGNVGNSETVNFAVGDSGGCRASGHNGGWGSLFGFVALIGFLRRRAR